MVVAHPADAEMLDPRTVTLFPTRTHRFRTNKAALQAVEWLSETLDRECRKLGIRAIQQTGRALELKWK